MVAQGAPLCSRKRAASYVQTRQCTADLACLSACRRGVWYAPGVERVEASGPRDVIGRALRPLCELKAGADTRRRPAGMALGTGSALAHRAVDSVLGSRHPEPAQAQVSHHPDAARQAQARSLFDAGEP